MNPFKKVKDFNQGIDVMDSITTDMAAKLSAADPESEEASKIAANLKTAEEIAQIKIRSKSEYLSGLVPTWVTGIAGMAMSLLVFKKVSDVELHGEGVFGGQAVNLWDKIVRKFGF